MSTTPLRAAIAAAAALTTITLVTACGDDSGDSGDSGDSDSPTAQNDTGGTDPCDLTEPAVVEAAIGAAGSGEEIPGTGRNCSYPLGESTVDVFYYGTAAEWEGIKQGYEANRGPLTEVAGVGDAAFNPGDVGVNEIVVLAGDTVFAVAMDVGSPEGVQPLAETIAAEQG